MKKSNPLWAIQTMFSSQQHVLIAAAAIEGTGFKEL